MPPGSTRDQINSIAAPKRIDARTMIARKAMAVKSKPIPSAGGGSSSQELIPNIANALLHMKTKDNIKTEQIFRNRIRAFSWECWGQSPGYRYYPLFYRS